MSKPIRGYSDIPGWFWWIDRQLFATILDAQADSAPGVVVELGTYMGKSAVIIGNHVRPGERFVGFVHIGTPTAVIEDRPRPPLEDVMTRWQG
jgi:hypothetical protein